MEWAPRMLRILTGAGWGRCPKGEREDRSYLAFLVGFCEKNSKLRCDVWRGVTIATKCVWGMESHQYRFSYLLSTKAYMAVTFPKQLVQNKLAIFFNFFICFLNFTTVAILPTRINWLPRLRVLFYSALPAYNSRDTARTIYRYSDSRKTSYIWNHKPWKTLINLPPIDECRGSSWSQNFFFFKKKSKTW